jgi:3-hydroxyisobutyrate dehydrogenase-like beta-hydroxyacid dehydrogenase
MAEKIGFIGLGVMGRPMAAHLQAAGHDVTVYNRTREKAEWWVDRHGGSLALTPAEAAKGASFVFTCVGNDDDVRKVTLAYGGALHAMQPGSVLVDHTTASAGLARELYADAASRRIAFLDAPVTGGQSGAENGKLSVMVGGDAETFKRARAVIRSYASTIKHMGGPGTGHLTKMANQVCIAGLLQALAEGLAFATAVGLDPRAVIEVISHGAARSWQMENRALTMIEGKFDFGFAVDWMRKDLAMTLAEAREHGVELPITEIVDRFYAELQAAGGGRRDTSSLITRLLG